MVWGSFLIAAAALKTPARNGDKAHGVNFIFLQAIDDGDYEFRIGLEGECERYLHAVTAAGLRGETDPWAGV